MHTADKTRIFFNISLASFPGYSQFSKLHTKNLGVAWGHANFHDLVPLHAISALGL